MPKAILNAPRIICDLADEESASNANETIIIPPDQAHHIINVMRLSPGDPIEIISRSSHRKYIAEILTIDKEVHAKIKSQSISENAKSRVSTLLFALCKGDKNEFVAEKACELGVRKVIFWQAEHSVAKIKNADDAQKKSVRWNKICEAAAKQCGNPLITQAIFAPSLKSCLELVKTYSISEDLKFCCSLSAEARQLKDLALSPCNTHIAIGPEGDFSNNEEELIKQAGFSMLSLGPTTLRAETAAVVAVSSVNALWGYDTE